MAPRLTSNTKVVIVLVAALALVAGAVVAGIAIFRSKDEAANTAECLVPAADGTDLELTAVNLQHASTINAVGIAKHMTPRARIIAVATAYQESSLRNLPNGDRDSVGLFQQRPSQGWGTVEQIKDPIYSAGIFYDRLMEVPHWDTLPLTEAAQAVQYSGFPDAYAKWEDEATTLVDGLSGAKLVTLSCRAGAAASTAGAPPREPLGGTENLSPAVRDLLSGAQAELGGLTLKSSTGEGTAATVSISLPGVKAEQAGRVLAAWMVAHEATQPLESVAVQNRTWTDHRWMDEGDLDSGLVSIVVAPQS
ncbi:hypothetical protein D1871_05420 [Nakamurella silvestris]|nr:hypothetical protein D1871_05420 [Nakamurella silvestris]